MQTLEQLTDASKSAWGTISQWIDHARNHCEVIKKDQSSAERELFTMQMQITYLPSPQALCSLSQDPGATLSGSGLYYSEC